MAIGDIVRPPASVPQPVAVVNVHGPVDAMTRAIGAYLAAQTFRVDGGEDNDRTFQLSAVYFDWPAPDKVIAYPSVSIIEAGETATEYHSLASTPLEDTWGDFDALVGLEAPADGEPGATCLWKDGEARANIQVDFWCDTKPDRQAIEAALGAIMNPHDGQGGVVVEGPERYYFRPCRFTLGTTRRDDSVATAGRGEWRLRCSVVGECDIVSLRTATVTQAPIVDIEVVDPSDPPEEDA